MEQVEKIANWLRRANRFLAILVGCVLLLCVGYTLVEIIMRRMGSSLGGVDEYSGYVMAIVTSWGMSYTLTERAHVRIDLIRQRLTPMGCSVFDLIALTCLSAATLIISWYGWGVLSKSISANAHANTALETPLWIPQVLWWSGWVWFSISALLLLMMGVIALAQQQYNKVDQLIGMDPEGEVDL